MKSRILLFPALLLAPVLIAETGQHLQQRFPAHETAKLVVDVDWGNIEVTTNGSSETTVDVVRKVNRNDKGDEESFLRDRPVTMVQEGNTVRVISHAAPHLFLAGRSRKRTEAQYTISVPATCEADLKTSGGSVAVSDLHGAVDIRTSGGGLKLARLHGPLQATTSGGSIRVTDCQGEQRLKTSGGGITVAGGGGNLSGGTSGGKVEVHNFTGPVQVGTSGGAIHLDNVAGKVKGSTSGASISARFSALLSAPVELKTSGGGVTVQVPEQAAFNLDASTSGGSVHSELPVATKGKRVKQRMQGPINGGGKTMVLRTSGGSIQVKKL